MTDPERDRPVDPDTAAARAAAMRASARAAAARDRLVRQADDPMRWRLRRAYARLHPSPGARPRRD